MKLKEKLQNILNAITLNLKSWKTFIQSATALRNKLAGSLKGKTEKATKVNLWKNNFFIDWIKSILKKQEYMSDNEYINHIDKSEDFICIIKVMNDEVFGEETLGKKDVVTGETLIL